MGRDGSGSDVDHSAQQLSPTKTARVTAVRVGCSRKKKGYLFNLRTKGTAGAGISFLKLKILSAVRFPSYPHLARSPALQMGSCSYTNTARLLPSYRATEC